MPPRPRSPATQPYYPAADTATFRDLLLFEERLKRNAGLLKRKKSRYQFYLLLLVSAVLVFLSDVLLETELCLFPLNHAVYYYYSYTRSIERIKVDTWRTEDDADAGIYFHLPPYVKTGCLFILGVTLFLFFASGMYSERVGYANKYVPHANKALRSFNMYLNVRTQPLPSRLSRMAASIGLGALFSAPPPKEPSQPSSPITVSTPRARTRSLSPPSFASRKGKASEGSYGVIPVIPPSSNPRGELIFSSRVHAAFREGYERYRENYERRLQSGGGAATMSNNQNQNQGPRMKRNLLERFKASFGGGSSGVATGGESTPGMMFGTPGGPGAETPLSYEHQQGGMVYSTGSPTSVNTPGSVRGRLSSGSTPSGSRRSSPAPGGSVSGSIGSSGSPMGKKGSRRRQGARISRQGTPLLEIVESIRADGARNDGEQAAPRVATSTSMDAGGSGTTSVDEGGLGVDPLLGASSNDTDPSLKLGRGTRGPGRSRRGSYGVS